MAVLNDLSQKTPAELIAIIMAQREASQRKLTMKVTEKGGLSCYGLGRFPVTLYRGQWERLLGEADAIRAFIVANADKLATKE